MASRLERPIPGREGVLRSTATGDVYVRVAPPIRGASLELIYDAGLPQDIKALVRLQAIENDGGRFLIVTGSPLSAFGLLRGSQETKAAMDAVDRAVKIVEQINNIRISTPRVSGGSNLDTAC